MKIEVRCPGCGKGYLVDEAKIPSAGGQVTCKACGRPIELRASSPKATSEPPAPRPAKTLPANGGGAREEVVCPRCGLHFEPAATTAARREASRPAVLVVEDLAYFREIAKDALAPRYEVHEATSLRDAREILASRRIDLILLDLTLENGEDGLTLLREFRPKACPVLIYTAEDETELYGESWDRLRALGADDLVMKGLNAGDLLVRKAAELLGQSEGNDAAR